MADGGSVDSDWNWSPDHGPWRLDEHGFPDLPTRVDISTAGVDRGEAYDYWRNIAFTDFTADRISRGDEYSFRAAASGLTCTGADFFVTESDAVSGRRSAAHIGSDGLDSLSLGLVLGGQRQAREGDGDAVTTSAGGLFLYDADKPGTVVWSRHRAMYLVIRRAHVEEVLGRDIPPTASLMRMLDRSPLKHVLREQLGALGRHKDRLAPKEQMFLLDQTRQLALFALSRSIDGDQPGPPDSILVATAMSHIERHCAALGLGADSIARDLGCSRSTLYRAFAAQGLKIAECIRIARLERAKLLLEQSAPSVSIARIAESCGIFDTVNFSRQFRRHFGCTPSELRRNFR